MTAPTPLPPQFLDAVQRRARAAEVFAKVEQRDGMLVCPALNSAEPAEYRVFADGGKLWVSLATPNRWLSESIESDLVHTGDDLGELIEEELVELGEVRPMPTFEHFRSDDLLFTFRTPVPVNMAELTKPEAAEKAATYLLAYEACFRQLGDMDAGDDEE